MKIIAEAADIRDLFDWVGCNTDFPRDTVTLEVKSERPGTGSGMVRVTATTEATGGDDQFHFLATLEA